MNLFRRLTLPSLLVLGCGLLALQCSDPLAEDCSLTLSCGDQPRYGVDIDGGCKWVDLNNGTPWTASPIYDHMDARWEWRDGRPTDTQEFGCTPEAPMGGNGGSNSLGNDGGTGLGGTSTIPDTHCSNARCSEGLACDVTSGNCVGCTEETQCGDVGHCNIELHTCVPCIVDEHCPPTAPRCAQNACVACIDNAQCNRFPARAECVDGVCSECTDNTQCVGNQNGSECDPVTHSCAQCINDAQCTDAAASRCGPNGTCVGCTDGDQCEGVATTCRTDGRCVQCISPGACSTVTAPICNADGLCSECQVPEDCGQFTLTPVCDTAQTPNKCVECANDGDCTSPTDSQCTNNECGECQNNDDCIGQAEGGVCDTSQNPNRCVVCTGTQDDACGAFVCDSRAKSCSTTATPGSAVSVCAPCISDAHCGAARRCVEQFFPNDPPGQSIGFFCLTPQTTPQSGAPCAAAGRPFFRVFTAPTIDGVSSDLCGIQESSCVAYNDFVTSKACVSLSDDAACGAPNASDGACVANGGGFQCSMSCSLANQCLLRSTGAERLCIDSACDP